MEAMSGDACGSCGFSVGGRWENGEFECITCGQLLPVPCGACLGVGTVRQGYDKTSSTFMQKCIADNLALDHLRKLIADGAPNERVMDWVWKHSRP